MQPWTLEDTADVPDGSDRLELRRRGQEWSIRLRAGGELMNSRAFGSEQALAELGCATVPARGRVLVGGLGLGHTLAATLAVTSPATAVVVAELVPAVVRWNRGPLGHLAGHPLDDARTTVVTGDVADQIRGRADAWDAVLLDVDNGPDGLTRAENDWLYSASGLAALRDALRPGGTLAVWSAHRSPRFVQRLRATGLRVDERGVRARAGKRGARHTVWLAHKGAVTAG